MATPLMYCCIRFRLADERGGEMVPGTRWGDKAARLRGGSVQSRASSTAYHAHRHQGFACRPTCRGGGGNSPVWDRHGMWHVACGAACTRVEPAAAVDQQHLDVCQNGGPMHTSPRAPCTWNATWPAPLHCRAQQGCWLAGSSRSSRGSDEPAPVRCWRTWPVYFAPGPCPWPPARPHQVTLGNLVAGAVLTAGAYSLCYGKPGANL